MELIVDDVVPALAAAADRGDPPYAACGPRHTLAVEALDDPANAASFAPPAKIRRTTSACSGTMRLALADRSPRCRDPRGGGLRKDARASAPAVRRFLLRVGALCSGPLDDAHDTAEQAADFRRWLSSDGEGLFLLDAVDEAELPHSRTAAPCASSRGGGRRPRAPRRRARGRGCAGRRLRPARGGAWCRLWLRAREFMLKRLKTVRIKSSLFP